MRHGKQDDEAAKTIEKQKDDLLDTVEERLKQTADKLNILASSWPDLAVQHLSLGDATIKDVAEHYAQMGSKVEILTGDQGLKSYEPITPVEIPRRRRR